MNNSTEHGKNQISKQHIQGCRIWEGQSICSIKKKFCKIEEVN